MELRDVLRLLEENRDRALSGEEMARALSVSRAAVWKAVRSLKAQGHLIEAVPNRGYRLREESDVLTAEGIASRLASDCDVYVQGEADSTNALAMRYVSERQTVRRAAFLAETQTQGRGRQGRRFFSPRGGLYLSVALFPDCGYEEALRLTTYAAVAVARTVESYGMAPKIKWVNDVFLHGKKICGILTEAVSDCETGRVTGVAVGIGINLRMTESFPEEVRAVAGALDSAPPRNEIAARLIDEFFSLVDGRTDVRAEYKARLLGLGREVSYERQGTTRRAVMTDVAPDLSLIVTEDGETRVLSAGEIRLSRESLLAGEEG